MVGAPTALLGRYSKIKSRAVLHRVCVILARLLDTFKNEGQELILSSTDVAQNAYAGIEKWRTSRLGGPKSSRRQETELLPYYVTSSTPWVQDSFWRSPG